ncbi:MAG: IclR family transcriptional regulator, partial [Anaerolineae bacterium]
GRVLYVEVIHSGRSLSVAPLVGRRLPAYCSASGKAMLAFQPPDVIEGILHEPLRQFTETTITSPARLREELERIRERGYALDNGELEAAIRAVAAPILDLDGYADAAVGLVGPASRLTIETLTEMAPAVVETAQAIAGQMPVRFTV